MKESLARQFFDKIAAGGVTAVKNLVNSDPPTFENDWLDFKSGQCPAKEIPPIWSKALSGFANTQGGVLIWGIDARKNPETQIDCAGDFVLVDTPSRLRSRLQELSNQASDPPLSGIEYLTFEDLEHPGKGFVVCYIPEGRNKPYRAESCERNYFIRAGQSFSVPSPALLRSLFFPQYYSNLWIDTSVHKARGDNQGYCIDFVIHNTGVASAKDLLVNIELTGALPSAAQFRLSNNWEEISQLVDTPEHAKGLTRYYLCRKPIHPGVCLLVFSFDYRIVDGMASARHRSVVFDMTLSCENNAPQHNRIEYTCEEVEDGIPKSTKSSAC